MASNLPAVVAPADLPAVRQADTDRGLIATWIERHESRHTRKNYERQARRFLASVDRPIREVRVGDVQAFLAGLAEKAPATRAKRDSDHQEPADLRPRHRLPATERRQGR